MKIKHIQEAITDPAKARAYIKDFYSVVGKSVDSGFVETNSRRIEFATMTDDDAVFVASQFQSLTAEVARNLFNGGR